MTPRRAVLVPLAIVGLLVVAYLLIARTALSWDLTAEHSASLSDETHRVLDALDHRIAITAFYPRDALGRVEAATLLARYRRANRNVTYRVLDPRLAPGEAERLNVVEIGSSAVQDLTDEDKVEVAQYTIEIDVTSAIARLLRGEQGTVCFSSGHGERSIDEAGDESFSQAASLLRSNAYDTRTIDLLTAKKVSSNCAALVVASPTNELSKRARKRIDAYADDNGKLMLLADPSSHTDLTPLAKRYGIRFVRGTVLEGDDGSHLPGDVTAPIVSRYSNASAVVRGLGPTFLPRTMGVETKELKDPGLTSAVIAWTSELGYLDRDDASDFDPDVDAEGPVGLIAMADRSEVRNPGKSNARIDRTRVLAIGDVHFATDAFLSDGSNGRLFLQAVDWLTQPEDLVTAVPNFPKLRELRLTQARSRYILFLTAGVVPGLFVIAGAFVWVVRRSR